jgi:hypothetical protein
VNLTSIASLIEFDDEEFATTDKKPCGATGAGLVTGCTCSSDLGISWTSRQCEAFARYVYLMVNGKQFNVGFNSFASFPEDNQFELTPENLHGELQKWGANSYVRGKTGNGSPHSIFIVSYTINTVTICHSNFPGRCQVELKTLSYTDFLSRLKWYHAFRTVGAPAE